MNGYSSDWLRKLVYVVSGQNCGWSRQWMNKILERQCMGWMDIGHRTRRVQEGGYTVTVFPMALAWNQRISERGLQSASARVRCLRAHENEEGEGRVRRRPGNPEWKLPRLFSTDGAILLAELEELGQWLLVWTEWERKDG